MGYMRPTSNYNRGKLQEFNDRKYFKECLILDNNEFIKEYNNESDKTLS
jgi:hypothetical protein